MQLRLVATNYCEIIAKKGGDVKMGIGRKLLENFLADREQHEKTS